MYYYIFILIFSINSIKKTLGYGGGRSGWKYGSGPSYGSGGLQ